MPLAPLKAPLSFCTAQCVTPLPPRGPFYHSFITFFRSRALLPLPNSHRYRMSSAPRRSSRRRVPPPRLHGFDSLSRSYSSSSSSDGDDNGDDDFVLDTSAVPSPYDRSVMRREDFYHKDEGLQSKSESRLKSSSVKWPRVKAETYIDPNPSGLPSTLSNSNCSPSGTTLPLHDDDDTKNDRIESTSMSNSISQLSFTPSEVSLIRSKLLRWYMQNHREFPWRLPPNTFSSNSKAQNAPGQPYAIWVSEVMSQQTRIEVVVGYYTRWMTEFPTIDALASAPLERVNELWSGLGYYRRARFLHEGAQQVMRDHGGKLPGDLKRLRAIAGIGPYTAGAIASIAFGLHTPCVDGNVERVLARLRPQANFQNSSEKKNKSDVWWKLATQLHQLATQLHQKEEKKEEDMNINQVSTWQPGDLNQALMELGATVCKPRAAALCHMCPLREVRVCGAAMQAEERGLEVEEYGQFVAQYPIPLRKKSGDSNRIEGDDDDDGDRSGSSKNGGQNKKKRKRDNDEDVERGERVTSKGVKVRNERVVTVVAWTHGGDADIKDIEDDGGESEARVLVMQRPGDGLLAGLWECANIVCPDDEDEERMMKMTLDRVLREKVESCCGGGAIARETMERKGEARHIFSHIRQRLEVLAVRVDNVSEREGVTRDGVAFRWVGGEELERAAIPTQMKKVVARALRNVAGVGAVVHKWSEKRKGGKWK